MSLIEQHLGIAKKITGYYIVKYSAYHLRDDLNSAAVEGVVTAVDRIERGLVEHDNYNGYICYYIHQFLGKEIRKNQFMVPPQRSTQPTCCSLELPIAIDDPAIEISDTMEALSVAINGDGLHRRIVDLRIKGFTDGEIGEILGVKRLVVQRAKTHLHNIWRELNV
jgi:DNA-directed RNA polymerase specialized sigma subunit